MRWLTQRNDIRPLGCLSFAVGLRSRWRGVPIFPTRWKPTRRSEPRPVRVCRPNFQAHAILLRRPTPVQAFAAVSPGSNRAPLTRPSAPASASGRDRRRRQRRSRCGRRPRSWRRCEARPGRGASCERPRANVFTRRRRAEALIAAAAVAPTAAPAAAAARRSATACSGPPLRPLLACLQHTTARDAHAPRRGLGCAASVPARRVSSPPAAEASG